MVVLCSSEPKNERKCVSYVNKGKSKEGFWLLLVAKLDRQSSCTTDE